MRSLPLHLIPESAVAPLAAEKPWLATTGFTGAAHTFAIMPNASGEPDAVYVGLGKESPGLWTLGSLPAKLPNGYRYHLPDAPHGELATQLWLGWELGRYRFTRYKAADKALPELDPPVDADARFVAAARDGIFHARDLINAPANDLNPATLADAACDLAARHTAQYSVTTGDALLDAGYPLVHAVGRASATPPCLIDLRWTGGDKLKLTLVGKGVCFDSGGLDIKNSSGMRWMKKDMGGAAQVLALAGLIMSLQLPVTLRVLIPAVENGISGNAMRPGDIVRSRKGTTVEIGNTDAEGRLILADCLWEASQDKPDLLIDCATLTGAARVALGTDLPALFCNDDALANEILAAGGTDDPLWRLPLHAPYLSQIKGKVADLCNISSSSFGGAIIGGLFLQEFVGEGIPWAHIDLMAWRNATLPGRPEGGDVMGLFALLQVIQQRTGMIEQRTGMIQQRAGG